jgi:hypothetical protein
MFSTGSEACLLDFFFESFLVVYFVSTAYYSLAGQGYYFFSSSFFAVCPLSIFSYILHYFSVSRSPSSRLTSWQASRSCSSSACPFSEKLSAPSSAGLLECEDRLDF